MIATFYFKKKDEYLDVKCSLIRVDEALQGGEIVKIARLIDSDPPISGIALNALHSITFDQEESK